jgi:putative phosphoribosyl transferase
MSQGPNAISVEHQVRLPIDGEALEGTLSIPAAARGIVVFAHGSGSSRHSPRNRFVAGALCGAGLATLLVDLLTPGEETLDLRTRQLRFDITLLARRLGDVTGWATTSPSTRHLALGYFGASTGAAAALVAAAARPEVVGAIVSRGGRPDLAGEALSRVRAPTLLIVGGDDVPVIGLNRDAMRYLMVEKELAIVTGATHLFEEPGALEEVARLAAGWFSRYLSGPPA